MWERKTPAHAFLGGVIVAAVATALVVATRLTEAQGAPAAIPRFADGHVNLSGIWQANNTANWDILTHRESWFDRAGNYQTSSLHVVERYTPNGRDVLQYEATIEDPQLYARPWKISMPLYRRPGAERAAGRIQVRRVR